MTVLALHLFVPVDDDSMLIQVGHRVHQLVLDAVKDPHASRRIGDTRVAPHVVVDEDEDVVVGVQVTIWEFASEADLSSSKTKIMAALVAAGFNPSTTSM